MIKSLIGVKLNDRVRNEVISKECGVKENVAIKIKKNILRWFGHVERRLTKEIYEANLGGDSGREDGKRFLTKLGKF
jgi:hypothetical protein